MDVNYDGITTIRYVTDVQVDENFRRTKECQEGQTVSVA